MKLLNWFKRFTAERKRKASVAAEIEKEKRWEKIFNSVSCMDDYAQRVINKDR